MFGFKKKETYLYEKLDGYARLTRYGGSEPEVAVACEYEGLPVTEIGENAFYDAGKAETITIPECVKRIGTNAFRGCKSLKRVVLPDSCEYLGDYAFEGCRSLESVALSSGITEIMEGTFSKCASLKSFTIPSTVKSIGEEAFAGCAALEFLDLGSGVSKIGEKAFKNCSKALSLVLPEELTIEDAALIENVNMIYRRGKRGIALLQYGGHETEIVIPDKLGNEDIIAIGPGVFRMFAYLEKITLPSRLLFIGEQAFAGCSGLKGITFPETLEVIGKGAFSGCGPRVNRPGYMARRASDYDDDDGISEITLPASLKTVDDMAFAGCSALTSINIKGGNVKLGGACFLSCPIESVVIPEGITELQAEIFRGCSRLKSVKLPSTLESIWERAFVDCESLESITLPEKLEVLGEGAFMGCVGLKQLTIPAKVRSIGDAAFAFCLFDEITVDPRGRNYTFVDNCLIENATGRLLSACVGEGAALTLPAQVKEITQLALAGSPIKELTVPATVKKIGEWALRGSLIEKLTVLNEDIELGNGILLETGDVDVQPDGSKAVDVLIGTANKE